MRFLRDKNLLVELLALAAVMVALELSLFPGCLTQWNPSPLWVIVLIVSMRYGSPAGIVGGALAAALHLWNLTREGFSVQDLLHRYPEMLTAPALFIFVGMYLGETRERLAKRADFYKNMVDELNRKLDENEIRRMNLERDHLTLEKRIAGQTDTLLGVYENLGKLAGAGSEDELLGQLVDVVQSEMRAEACGIWRMSPPRLLAVSGAMAERPPPLAGVAARRRDVVILADWTDLNGNEAPGADVAGVVLDDDDGAIVIAVSGVGFGNLNRASVIFFRLAVERAGTLVREIRRFEQLRLASVAEPGLGLGSASYLRNRIHEQVLLARRHRTDLTILSCAFLHEPPKRLANRLQVVLACSIRAAVRASDGIAHFGGSDSFVVLLPQSDLSGAGVVMGKIKANLALLDLRDSEGGNALALKWNVIPVDGSRDEAAMYRELFGGMAPREATAT